MEYAKTSPSPLEMTRGSALRVRVRACNSYCKLHDFHVLSSYLVLQIYHTNPPKPVLSLPLSSVSGLERMNISYTLFYLMILNILELSYFPPGNEEQTYTQLYT